MSDWQDMKLGDIAVLTNGTNFTKESFGRGLKILGVRDFGDRTMPDWGSCPVAWCSPVVAASFQT
jgi:hypothetical protein